MPSTNILMLQEVAEGLEELRDQVVFVGGAIAELYADDPAASDIRPTLDVDCVIELSSRSEHSNLEETLRSKGFTHDTSNDAPICRMLYNSIMVDIMPAGDDVFEFTNIWYIDGIRNRISKQLPDGTDIYVFPPTYFLATKFDAHNDRGGNDLRQSHDFEDIIYVMDNCTDLIENIINSDENLKSYLKGQCQDLIESGNLTEGIEAALPYGSDSESTEIIESLILSIAEIE